MATHQKTLVPMIGFQPQSSTTEQTPPPQTSGFFNLSAEIRNIIYSEVVECHNDVWITASNEGDNGQHTHLALATSPAIAQACRLTRAEALPIFFGNNTFSITLIREGNVTCTKRWIAAIGDAGVKQIRHLRLSGHKALGYRREYNAPCTRLQVERSPDGCVDVVDCYTQDYRWKAFAGPVHEVKACIYRPGADLKPLSRVEDLGAVVETFASQLYFREDEGGKGLFMMGHHGTDTAKRWNLRPLGRY